MRRWWSRALLGALLGGLAAIAACDGDGGAGQASDGGTGAVDGGGDAGAGGDGGAPDAAVTGDAPGTVDGVDLGGTWARREVHAALTTLPVVGETTTRTTAVFAVALQQDGAALTLTMTVCSLSIDNGTDLVQTVVPDALVDSLPVRTITARLEEDEAAGLRFVEERHVEIRGAQLASPSDPLPTDAADATVWDQDGDGHPGVTLRITGLVDGEIYVAQRRGSSAEGTVASADAIDALVTWDDEQVVLGTDNPLLGSERTSRPAPPEESFLRLRRVAAGATCADVLAREDELFGPRD